MRTARREMQIGSESWLLALRSFVVPTLPATHAERMEHPEWWGMVR